MIIHNVQAIGNGEPAFRSHGRTNHTQCMKDVGEEQLLNDIDEEELFLENSEIDSYYIYHIYSMD